MLRSRHIGRGILWLVAAGSASYASAKGEYSIECPCRLMASEGQVTVTLGVRNLESADITPNVNVYWADHPWPIGIASVGPAPANAVLPAREYDVRFKVPKVTWPGEHRLYLQAQGQRYLEKVYLDPPVNISSDPLEFDLSDLDYLLDADGDGVSDTNERIAGTDADDRSSTPGDSEIDVLVAYTPEVAHRYDYDPYTRFRHLMMLADEIFRRSQTGMTLRVVGYYEEVEEEDLGPLQDLYGADHVVEFSFQGERQNYCGIAPLFGARARGYLGPLIGTQYSSFSEAVPTCSAVVVAHEMGHAFGLIHDYRQGDFGTFRWSRGHVFRSGGDLTTGTVMVGGIPYFSDPDQLVGGVPVGRDKDEPDGADAVASLQAVRFQVAEIRPSQTDKDGDGVIDVKDAFPEDVDLWRDNDGDGQADALDLDDDNDGVVDRLDAFPRDSTESADMDDDGVGDNADVFPDDPAEWSDRDGDGVGDNGDAFPDDAARWSWSDQDGDGIDDNSDAFPHDATEWADANGNGIGDNSELADGAADTDGDGVRNEVDLYPLDPARHDVASYVIRGEHAYDNAGRVLVGPGDINGDGFGDLVIGAPRYSTTGRISNPVGAVYLLSGAHLTGADAADGKTDRVVHLGHVASQPDSWKFVGATTYARAGDAVAVGDWSGDGVPDLVIGEPRRNILAPRDGVVYLVNGTDFAAIDAADGAADGVVALANVLSGQSSWILVGGGREETAGMSVAVASQIVAGADAVVVGGSESAYVVSSKDLGASDTRDGRTDRIVQLANVAAEPSSWKLVADDAWDFEGRTRTKVLGVTAGDLDGDGHDEVVVVEPSSATLVPGSTYSFHSAVTNVIAGDRFNEVDGLDGRIDGVVELSRVADGERSWRLMHGFSGYVPKPTLAHLDADGMIDLLIGASVRCCENSNSVWTPYYYDSRSFLVYGRDLRALDTVFGARDGFINLIEAGTHDFARIWHYSLSAVGDVDGDGVVELAMPRHWVGVGGGSPPTVFSSFGLETRLLAASEMNTTLRRTPLFETSLIDRALDIAGAWRFVAGRKNRFLYIGANASGAGDVDGDGFGDLLLGPAENDFDSPGEVYLVHSSDFEGLDAVDGATDRSVELANLAGDTDGDGLLNTIDPDDDGDLRVDFIDAFPLDPTEWADINRDGYGDNGFDWDGDGVGDSSDAFPTDSSESADTDRDGIGDNADDDDDNDGVVDANDAFPKNAMEQRDSDGDGVGDNADSLPNDASESEDFDGDGIGNNADDDDDNDGVADVDDAFPTDAQETLDSDGDGVGDNADPFPNDSGESGDFDGDGIGDNADDDDDNDGVRDAQDMFPRFAAKSSLTSYRVDGEKRGHDFGAAVLALKDADGYTLVVGAPAQTQLRHSVPDSQGAEVYAIDSADLVAADARDGVDQRISARVLEKRLRGHWVGYGRNLAALGDLDADGRGDLLIGSGGPPLGINGRGSPLWNGGSQAPDWTNEIDTSTRVISLWNFDGDSGMDLVAGSPHLDVVTVVWGLDARGSDGTLTLHGEEQGDAAGITVASAGDVDGDGRTDILVSSRTATYLWRASDSIGELNAGGSHSRSLKEGLKFVYSEGRASGYPGSAGDVNGDGFADIIVEAYSPEPRFSGDPYPLERRFSILISGARLREMDVADGTADRVIDLSHVAEIDDNWIVDGGFLRLAGDIDGDDVPDFAQVIGDDLHLISGARLVDADLADGRADRRIEMWRASDWVLSELEEIEMPSLEVTSVSRDELPAGFALAGNVVDYDGDGFMDLIFGACSGCPGLGSAYFISATDLPLLDAKDGQEDRRVDVRLVGTDLIGRP